MSARDLAYAGDPRAPLLDRPVTIRTPTAREALALTALVGVIVTTLLVALAAPATTGFLPQTTPVAPRWMGGPLQGTGISFSNAGIITVLLAMFACYATAVGSASLLSARTVAAAILVVHLLVLVTPPLFSTDVFSYTAYARLGALYGANPYLVGPHAAALDPVFRYVGYKWTATPTVYGPLFTLLSYPLASLGLGATAFAFKALATVASLATVAIVWRAALLRRVDPVKAIALVGLNPLVFLYGVGGAHNDLLMLLPMVTGIYLILRRGHRSGAAATITAAAIKLTGALPLAFALLAGGAGAGRRRRDLLIGGLVAGLVFGGIGLGVFGTGILHMAGTLEQAQSRGGWHSIPGFLVRGLSLDAQRGQIALGFGSVFGLVLAALIWRVWRQRLDWLAAAGWASLALLLSASSLLPWYVAWLMPLAALGRDRRLCRAAVLATGVIQAINLIDYFPHTSFVWNL